VPDQFVRLVAAHIADDGIFNPDNLDGYQEAAVLWFEQVTHRSVVARTHRWVLRDFPTGLYQEIWLPRGKTQSVVSIQYVSGGVTTTLTGPDASPPGTDFLQDLSGDDGGVLMPLRGESWPSVDMDVPSPVTVTFTAGWAADAVPADVVHALLFAMSDMVDLRGSTDLAMMGATLSQRDSLASGYLLSRMY
jgi:hypothetical protein